MELQFHENVVHRIGVDYQVLCTAVCIRKLQLCHFSNGRKCYTPVGLTVNIATFSSPYSWYKNYTAEQLYPKYWRLCWKCTRNWKMQRSLRLTTYRSIQVGSRSNFSLYFFSFFKGPYVRARLTLTWCFKGQATMAWDEVTKIPGSGLFILGFNNEASAVCRQRKYRQKDVTRTGPSTRL